MPRPVALAAALLAVVPTLAAATPPSQDAPRITMDDLQDPPPGKLSEAAHARLERLVAATAVSDRERPSLVFRLAEHCRAVSLEQSAVGRALQLKIASARTPFARAALREQLKRAAEAERAWRSEAARLFTELAQRAGRGPAAFVRLDEVLYHLADLMRREQRMAEARAFLLRLIRDYPQSRYLPDAYAVFADYYFDQGKQAEALKLYQQVGRFPAAPTAGYARYREGWCQLRLGDAPRALERFVGALRSVDVQRRPTVAQEVRRSVVIAYASIGAPGKAPAFFARVGGTEAQAMLRQLAAVYRAARRAADAAMVEAAARHAAPAAP